MLKTYEKHLYCAIHQQLTLILFNCLNKLNCDFLFYYTYLEIYLK